MISPYVLADFDVRIRVTKAVFFHHISCCLVQLDTVSQFEGLYVSSDKAFNDITDDSTRTE